VEAVRPATARGSSTEDDAAIARASSAQVPLLAAESTAVHLLQPDDPGLNDTSTAIAGSGGSSTMNASAAAAPGCSSSTTERLSTLVQTARAAAKAAVVSSSAEAAAAAAERALLTGAAAASLTPDGYASLGGTAGYKASLRDLVYLPLRSPELFSKYRIRPPRGLLLHGPPGSGKTALARAAAADAGATLFVVNGPDVMSEYLGERLLGLPVLWVAVVAFGGWGFEVLVLGGLGF